MKRRTHRIHRKRRSTRRRGGGVGAPRPSAARGNTVRHAFTLGDGLTLHIVAFKDETAANITKLSSFFVTNCWKNPANQNEAVFRQLHLLRAAPGDFIYIKNAANKIVFAQLGILEDNRNNAGGEINLNVMGSCTDMAERGKGLFKRALQKMVEHYKTVTLHSMRGHDNTIEAIILTADKKDRDGVTAKGRHTLFAKSGMTLNGYIEGVHSNYIKTEDGEIYKVVPTSEHGNLKPDSTMEVIVEDDDRSHKKINVTTITGCYKNAAATEQEECPFILYL